MLLNYQISGEGQPLIIMHGLFGSLLNWKSQIKSLEGKYQVIAVDMRNHGKSSHCDTINYKLMTADIVELMQHLNISKAHILGHSMGGKAAMQLALEQPQLVDKLIIVDIAPVAYPPHHDEIFKGLFTVDLPSIQSRKEADQALSTFIHDAGLRSFLLTNLYKDEHKQYHWRMNLQCLFKDYDQISAAPEGAPYLDPVLFIKGSDSDYIVPEYREAVLSLFPQASYKIIKNTGHWPHAEKPEEFSKLVAEYLAS